MQHTKNSIPQSGSGPRSKQERGVALITTLLLLMLLSGLALAMAWSTQSDMLISGYYRNFRGSFYAADSGLNTVRQAMQNQFVPTTSGGALPDPTKFVAGTQPIPASTQAAIIGTLNATYGGGYTSVVGAGATANSWPEKFKLTNVTLAPYGDPTIACTWTSTLTPPPAPPSGLCSAPPPGPANFKYVYTYSITVQGQSKGNENTVLTDNGIITVQSNTSSTSTNKSFAAWGMFIDQYSLCSGATLVAGTITGPTFTNGAWNFGSGGKYTFTDPVGQAGADAGYQPASGGCVGVAGPSGGGIAPTFQQGFNLGQPTVPLPQNSYNQERAVLDGKGTGGSAVSSSDLFNSVKDVKGNPYPASGASSGVFLPYSSTINPQTGKAVLNFTGGGIYVQGDSTVTLSTSGSSAQIYTIKQGSTTTTVTIDPIANTTTMVSGSSTQVITGVPQQLDPTSGADLGYDTMLYANGNITGLSGPGSGQPAIQNGTALTITAANSITITGDILYKSEPVVLSGSNIDALIPANNTGQALGIFTATGNIDMHVASSGANLEIDASLATISQGGSGGLINTGNSIGTLTIVGGRIQNSIQNINTTTRNVLFDRRYASGFAPPWFPSTSLTPTGINSSPFQLPVVSRLSWQNQTPY